MNRLSFRFLIVSILMLASCSVPDMRLVRERSGANWTELKKVIDRYEAEGDPQKIEAMYRMLENMPYHSFLYSEGLVEAKDWYRQMRERPADEYRMICDSIASAVDPQAGLVRKWDVQVLDSAFLCENIDMAFKVWREQPWGKNVGFETFCRFILPYRIGDEIPQLWRRDYYEEYDSLLDEFRASDSLDVEDPVAAYKFMEARLTARTPSIFTTMSPVGFPHIGPEHARYYAGTCREICDFLVYVCRSLGIPCALDYRLNDGHYMTTLWNRDGEERVVNYFTYVVLPNEKDTVYNEVKPRVFRKTYEVNDDELARLKRGRERLPLHFRIPLYEDVTASFTPYYERNMTIPDEWLLEDCSPGTILYLCSLKKDAWVAEDYGVKGWRKTDFNGMQRGCVMCVAVEEGGMMRPVTVPFMISPHTGDVRFFTCEGTHAQVVLKSKYSLGRDEGGFREKMRCGAFEGSDEPSFSEPDTLLLVQRKPDKLFTEGKVYKQSMRSYRYVRFRGDYWSNSDVAEISLYDPKGNRIPHRRTVGTPECEPGHEFFRAFDGDPSTSFTHYVLCKGWTGVELERPSEVGSIVYTPRNRVNYIYAGDVYELMYYDGGWKSLGVKTADADSIVFGNVPDGNLLYLKNLSGGVMEMAFTYEGGKQVFYGNGLEIPPEDSGFERVSDLPWECSYTFLTPSADWFSPDYDDSAWETGCGPFGLKDGCVTPWSCRRLFVRYEFEYGESGDVPVLKYVVNDSAELYLNGISILEMTASESPQSFVLPHELLVSGVNMIAVKCFNESRSEDVVLDLEVL